MLSISPSIDHIHVEVWPTGTIAQLLVCTLMVSPMGQSHNRRSMLPFLQPWTAKPWPLPQICSPLPTCKFCQKRLYRMYLYEMVGSSYFHLTTQILQTRLACSVLCHHHGCENSSIRGQISVGLRVLALQSCKTRIQFLRSLMFYFRLQW